MDHFNSPRNRGKMRDPSAVGLSGLPGRGRYITLYLKIDESRIQRATFRSHGCGATIACASMLTEMVHGKQTEECEGMTSDDLLTALGGLPADKRHCAVAAVRALKSALQVWAAKKAERESNVS